MTTSELVPGATVYGPAEFPAARVLSVSGRVVTVATIAESWPERLEPRDAPILADVLLAWARYIAPPREIRFGREVIGVEEAQYMPSPFPPEPNL